MEECHVGDGRWLRTLEYCSSLAIRLWALRQTGWWTRMHSISGGGIELQAMQLIVRSGCIRSESRMRIKLQARQQIRKWR
jgi:hypothetical protein